MQPISNVDNNDRHSHDEHDGDDDGEDESFVMPYDTNTVVGLLVTGRSNHV